jgi:signal transduction histidine kinase
MTHELLTPLNSASLGMRLIAALADSGDYSSLHETIADVNKSLTSAVELLENLSCYDRVENHLLELHKEENVPVIDLLEECIWPFSPQAAELGVELDFSTIASTISSKNSSGKC